MGLDDQPFISVRELRQFERDLSVRLERLESKIDVAVRDLVRDQEKRLEALGGRVTKLEAFRNRAAGALAVGSFFLGVGLTLIGSQG